MLLIKLMWLFQVVNFAKSVSIMPTISRSIKLDRFDGMSRGKNVPIRMSFTIINTEAAAVYMNSTVHVSEDLPTAEPLATFKLIRCATKENLDTCEDFVSSGPNSYCSYLDAKQFNPTRIDYTPPFECPIKKGTYYTYNYKLDLKMTLVFPLGDWYWRFSNHVEDAKTKRVLYHFEGAGHLVKGH